MAGNNGGPWGGGGNSGGGGRGDEPENRGIKNGGGGGGRGPGDNKPQIPEIDELVKKGQEQLRVLMGGGGGRERSNGTGGGGNGSGPVLTRGTVGLGIVAAVVAWSFASFYTVRPEQQSIELFLGKFSAVGTEGLNFAPWPVVTAEVFDVTTNRTEELGVRRGGGGNDGLMLTTDENIVDIDFQVVWNIKNPKDFKFSLRDPESSVRAISESAMREVIAQSELAPILSRDRGAVADQVKVLIQSTLDNRQTGINVLRVNLNKVDPPSQNVIITNADGTSSQGSVVDAFRDVQAAEQERDRVERQADAYANRKTAEARGESAQLLEAAEGYRARVVNDAVGEASRFEAVLTEYAAAPDVTRKRLYIETMEKVLGDVDKIILENNTGGSGGQGVVPYLPLNELRRSGGSN
ncbi:FtsH protease activity modulator HflK [Sulfitobacter geojensis]|uniref:Protein HflK n=1 Tax=Sulfitobacter geojensis TaxID=1342299 RepID=A0AAE2VUW5_9RHOB|nr:FtsH protease activity modulator HflK [Sulfitobacter geojensis]MBM1687779.1 FtsH protease activity modulator HflK [Sulfitobacter geojensis]MBM1691846.1 FtsH protease activity modulator HflK [Sulfitobacter geojensis]MBM1704012.1 FtsH protease activity modulator HflK [Sulfitobacter geojensis]MBM1708070.1 FtsH protease activity modulator HflK [Sulfitobacter geojensis]MBM1712135.1 FtsH protease activity modulator HflK [Sulfitobacter geojensis]